MQKVIYIKDIEDYSNQIDSIVIEYVKDGQILTFEGFENFDIMAFEWYDVDKDEIETSKILIYIDREDIFIMCADDRTYNMASSIFHEENTNEKVLYHFFMGMLKEDTSFLAEYETRITESETRTEIKSVNGDNSQYIHMIIGYRKELLRLKKYYDQIDDIVDNLSANDNGLLSEEAIRQFTIIGNRTERFRSNVINMREYVTQMREAYQAQIDIEQNNLMRIFTVVTSVFLPLTLMVGWYGMNFKYMPELSYKYGYPVFIGVSIAISIFLILIFKKKKWF